MSASAPKLLRAGSVFDGTDGELRGPTELLVIDGRIAEIGGEVSRPDQVEMIDLTDRTISPGFIECHVHSQLTPERLLGTFYNESSAMKSLFGLAGLRALLMAGFTTVRDAASQDAEYGTVDLKRAVELGLIAGPRMFVCPHMLSGTGGHGEAPELDHSYHRAWMGVVDGPDAIRARVRKEILAGGDWTKVALSGFLGARGGDGPEHMSWSQEELDACVEASRDYGVETCVHALGDESVRRAVRSGARSVEHASFASAETLKMIEDEGTFVVPTMHVLNIVIGGHVGDVMKRPGEAPPVDAPSPSLLEYGDELVAAQRLLAGSDAKIAFGSDAGVFPHGEAWREFIAMTDAGISPLRALRAATSVAAELLQQADLGQLKVGAIADVIAMPGNPLEDIEVTGRVDFVMKQGTVHRRRDGH